MNLEIERLQAAIIPTIEQQARFREFVELVKAALCKLAEAAKKIFEWLAKHLTKSEPPKYKDKARFRIDRGKNPLQFNIAAYGQRHKPP